MNRLVQEFADRPVRVSDGEQIQEITTLEFLLQKLKAAAANGDVKALKLSLDLIDRAEREETKRREGYLRAAIEQKERWRKLKEECERSGEPLPDIWPHPEDIVIFPDGTIGINGAQTREEHERLPDIIAERDQHIDWLDNAIDFRMGDERCQDRVIEEICEVERLNSYLPDRLIRSWRARKGPEEEVVEIALLEVQDRLISQLHKLLEDDESDRLSHRQCQLLNSLSRVQVRLPFNLHLLSRVKRAAHF
jgi:hypothetical protein